MRTRGEILKKYIAKKIKRDNFASVLEISPQYLSSILNNKKRPSQSLLNKIMTALNVSEKDKEDILLYEESLREIKESYIDQYDFYDEKLRNFKKERLYINGIDYIDLFVIMKEKFLDFNKDDMLIFKKYENENLDKRYVVYENCIYYVRSADNKFILEANKIKVLKNFCPKYILVFEIRRR